MDPEHDAQWLRASFALARAAEARGDQPYGAVLVDSSGSVVAETGNTIVTTADCTAHAELNLVRGLGTLPAELLAGSTLYASAEPCAMCAGALYWGWIGRLVFGLSNARLYDEAFRGSPEALRLSCRDVLAAGERKVAVLGPLLEDEAAAVVAGCAATRGREGRGWNSTSPRSAPNCATSCCAASSAPGRSHWSRHWAGTACPTRRR